MAECVCPHSFPSPAATTSLVPYADKAISVVQSWPTIVLSQTRGLIAFFGCPRGNIVYTRFSAALSGTTWHLDTHPRRSTAMQCSIRKRRELNDKSRRGRRQVKRASRAYADFFILWRSYSSPRFHSERTMAASFRAMFTRAISGDVPFSISAR